VTVSFKTIKQSKVQGGSQDEVHVRYGITTKPGTDNKYLVVIISRRYTPSNRSFLNLRTPSNWNELTLDEAVDAIAENYKSQRGKISHNDGKRRFTEGTSDYRPKRIYNFSRQTAAGNMRLAALEAEVASGGYAADEMVTEGVAEAAVAMVTEGAAEEAIEQAAPVQVGADDALVEENKRLALQVAALENEVNELKVEKAELIVSEAELRAEIEKLKTHAIKQAPSSDALIADTQQRVELLEERKIQLEQTIHKIEKELLDKRNTKLQQAICEIEVLCQDPKPTTISEIQEVCEHIQELCKRV